MKVEITNNALVITLPIGTVRPSSSGKTLIVATTGGFVPTTAEYDGKPIAVSVNATVRK
jgi:hypothetical protein